MSRQNLACRLRVCLGAGKCHVLFFHIRRIRFLNNKKGILNSTLAKSRRQGWSTFMERGLQSMKVSRLAIKSYLTGWTNEITLPSLIIEISMPRRWNSSMRA